MPEDMSQTSEDVRMFPQIQAIAFEKDIKWMLIFFFIGMFYKIQLSHDPLKIAICAQETSLKKRKVIILFNIGSLNW